MTEAEVRHVLSRIGIGDEDEIANDIASLVMCIEWLLDRLPASGDDDH